MSTNYLIYHSNKSNIHFQGRLNIFFAMLQTYEYVIMFFFLGFIWPQRRHCSSWHCAAKLHDILWSLFVEDHSLGWSFWSRWSYCGPGRTRLGQLSDGRRRKSGRWNTEGNRTWTAGAGAHKAHWSWFTRDSALFGGGKPLILWDFWGHFVWLGRISGATKLEDLSQDLVPEPDFGVRG